MARIPRPGTLAHAMGTLLLFGMGVGAGVLAFERLSSEIDYGPYPPRREAAEPVAADRLTDLLAAGDDSTLAVEFDEEILTQLSGALRIGQQSLVSVSDIRYLGTVAEGEEALASYVALGKFNSGQDVVIGFAVRVRDGEVVGVN